MLGSVKWTEKYTFSGMKMGLEAFVMVDSSSIVQHVGWVACRRFWKFENKTAAMIWMSFVGFSTENSYFYHEITDRSTQRTKIKIIQYPILRFELYLALTFVGLAFLDTCPLEEDVDTKAVN